MAQATNSSVSIVRASVSRMANKNRPFMICQRYDMTGQVTTLNDEMKEILYNRDELMNKKREIDILRTVLKKKHKKSFTVSMDKPSVNNYISRWNDVTIVRHLLN